MSSRHGRPAIDALPFLWGAATSAHQVEGGNAANQWWAWEQRPDTPCAEPSGAACEHLTRYPQDLALLAEVGLNCYRFSVEWSRVEPRPGDFSARWLAHYREMAACCRRLELLPVVTLHHFTDPLWVAAAGGWENPQTAGWFARYATRVIEALGDLAALVITINEPNIPALLGYELGVFPPGRRERAARLRVTDTFLSGHRAAVEAVRSVTMRLPVGLALAMAEWHVLPGGEAHVEEWRGIREDIFLPGCAGDDFLGVNTYTRHRLGSEGWLGEEPGVELTAAGWEFWPEAVEATLRRAWSMCGGRLPLILTETGVATDDDARRVEFLERAVAAMERARVGGVDVRGFIAWSALDNFEWQHGYSQRFGLIAVDRATQRRTLRASARRLGMMAQRSAAAAQSVTRLPPRPR